METTTEKTIETKKKLVITKKVGLNGKSGERRANSRSRAARVKANECRQKVKDEPRDETPSGRDQPDKEKTKKHKKKPTRKTTIRASLPKHSIKSVDCETKPEEEEKESILPLVEPEIGCEGPTQDDPTTFGIEEEDKEETQEEGDSKTVDDTGSTIDGGGEETVVGRQQTEEETPFETAKKAADAVLYTIGKFIGENTCYEPESGKCDEVIVKEGKKTCGGQSHFKCKIDSDFANSLFVSYKNITRRCYDLA